MSPTRPAAALGRLNAAAADRSDWLCYLIAGLPICALFNTTTLLRAGGWTIRPQDVLTVLLLLCTPLSVLRSRRYRSLVWPWALCLAVYYAAIAAAPVLFPYGTWNWKVIGRYALVLCWGAVAIRFYRSQRAFLLLLHAVPVSGAVIGLFSLYEYVQRPGLQRIAGYFSAATGEGFERQAAFNEIGALHGLSICLLTVLLSFGGRKAYRWPFLALASLNLAGLLLSASRSGLLSVLAGEAVLAAYLARNLRRPGRRLLWVAAGAGALVIVGTYGYGLLAEQGFSIRVVETFQPFGNARTSALMRLEWWTTALDFAVRNPHYLLFGLGPGNFAAETGVVTFDSYYIEHAMGEGVVGAGALLMLVWWPLRSLRRRTGRSPLAVAGVVAVAVAATVALTGNTVVDPTFGSIFYTVLYGAMGATSAQPA